VSDAGISSRIDTAWAVLATVPDPEVPAVSLIDLGIVREVIEHADGIEVVLTPTYSGCPATEVIQHMVLQAMQQAKVGPVRVSYRLAPAWTTDWITAQGKNKLREYGIAPPGPVAQATVHVHPRRLPCPRCNSTHTERLSAFGSTACKALYRCLACQEPFEYFKPL
jgi:ring-1,2-phenylacetyl-CoA epoxidase subunit PaaD